MRESGPSVRAVGTWFGVPWGPGAALARSFQFPRRAPTDEKRAQIERLLRPGEQLVLLTESDIASDGTFGRSWLAVSDQRVMTFGDGEVRVPLVEAALADLKEARCVHRVGRAALETQFDGRKVELVRYTNSYNEKLARVSKELQKAPEFTDDLLDLGGVLDLIRTYILNPILMHLKMHFVGVKYLEKINDFWCHF